MAARLERDANWLAALLLLLFWGRLLHVTVVKSDTFDEIIHIMQGVLFWRQKSLYPVVENPPLVNALIGLPVNILFRPQLPLQHPIWITGNWLRISQVFAWEVNNNGRLLVWMGRVAVIFLALLLAALLYRWGRQLFRRRAAGLLPLFLFTFDPNVLAHSSLATTDLGAAFFVCLAAYLVWRYWREPGWRRYLAGGAGIGLAMAAKFTGLVMVPALALLAAYRLWSAQSRPGFDAGKESRQLLLEVSGWLTLASFLLIAVYRFDLAALAADFARQQSHLSSGHSSYLLGELSTSGWWYYFPVVFAAKTPLLVLALLILGIVLLWRRGDCRWSHLWLLIIAGGIFAASFFSRVNLGYRYLLPALPLLYLFLGGVVPVLFASVKIDRRPQTGDPLASSGQAWRPAFIRGGATCLWGSPEWLARPVSWLVFALLLLVAVTSLSIHPHYLAYFNRLAGGPEEGWRVAVDSNIDWGQDLTGLATYLEEHEATSVQVSYLGTAPLAAYGIQGRLLPVWPAPDREPLYDPFYPPRPAPGLYALSVTQLLGVYADDPDYFAWFQERPPDDKVGYSLFIYDIAADGPPVGLALSGIGISAIALEDFDRAFASNDVRPRWYDARSSFLWPGGERPASIWAAVGDGHQPSHPALQALYPAAGPALRGESPEGLRYALFRLDESPVAATVETERVITSFGWPAAPVVGSLEWETERQPLTGAAVFSDTLQLLGYSMPADMTPQPGLTVDVLTYWQVNSRPPAGLKIFLHLLDARGHVVAQHDGLDVRAEALQPGDAFAQLHTVHLPAHLPGGRYAWQIGVYDSGSGERFFVPTDGGSVDRLLLHAVWIDDR